MLDRAGRKHHRDDADDQQHGHLHAVGGPVDGEVVVRLGVEHVEGERARDRDDAGEPGASDDRNCGSSGRVLGAGTFDRR